LASAAANASSLSCFLHLGFSSASLSSSFLEDRFFLGLESLLSSISKEFVVANFGKNWLKKEEHVLFVVLFPSVGNLPSSLAAAAFFFFEAAVAFFTGMTSSSMSDG